jgi:hypothetical protein
MLKANLKFVIIGSAILSVFIIAGYSIKASIAQTTADNRPTVVISGRVISEYGPVENARVRIAGEEDFTLTDRQGYYELQSAYLRARD